MRKRLAIGVLVAGLLVATVGAVRLWAAGEYNGNPAYCHTHWIWDQPLWTYWECWLPDPPWGEG